MKKISIFLILILVLSSLTNASWFTPTPPPPIIYTNISGGSGNITGGVCPYGYVVQNISNLGVPSCVLNGGNITANLSNYYTKQETNNTIDAKIATTIYLPTELSVEYGTINNGGNVGNISYVNHGVLNISESNVNGITIYVNFTGVTQNITSIQYYARYVQSGGSKNHFIEFQMQDCNDLTWEDHGGVISDSTGFNGYDVAMFDSFRHVCNDGTVRTRFIHNSGNYHSGDYFYLDMVNALKGMTVTGQTGSLDPRYLYTSGANSMVGNLTFFGSSGVDWNYVLNKPTISNNNNSAYYKYHEVNLDSGYGLGVVPYLTYQDYASYIADIQNQPMGQWYQITSNEEQSNELGWYWVPNIESNSSYWWPNSTSDITLQPYLVGSNNETVLKVRGQTSQPNWFLLHGHGSYSLVKLNMNINTFYQPSNVVTIVTEAENLQDPAVILTYEHSRQNQVEDIGFGLGEGLRVYNAQKVEFTHVGFENPDDPTSIGKWTLTYPDVFLSTNNDYSGWGNNIEANANGVYQRYTLNQNEYNNIAAVFRGNPSNVLTGSVPVWNGGGWGVDQAPIRVYHNVPNTADGSWVGRVNVINSDGVNNLEFDITSISNGVPLYLRNGNSATTLTLVPMESGTGFNNVIDNSITLNGGDWIMGIQTQREGDYAPVFNIIASSNPKLIVYNIEYTLGPVSVPTSFYWDAGATYVTDDVVRYNGFYWTSLQDNNIGNTPQEDAFWTIGAADVRGASKEYPYIIGTNGESTLYLNPSSGSGDLFVQLPIGGYTKEFRIEQIDSQAPSYIAASNDGTVNVDFAGLNTYTGSGWVTTSPDGNTNIFMSYSRGSTYIFGPRFEIGTDNYRQPILLTNNIGKLSEGLAGFGNSADITDETNPKRWTLSENQYNSLWGSDNTGTDVYRNAGKVGIGTTEPKSLLEIGRQNVVQDSPYTNTLLLTRYWAANDNTRASSISHYMDGNYDMLAFGVSGDDAGAHTNYNRPDQSSMTKMVIRSDGKVGIGTANPQNKLEVYDSESSVIKVSGATSHFPHFSVQSGNGEEWLFGTQDDYNSNNLLIGKDGNYFMQISPSGDVGIASNDPQAKLDIRTDTPDDGIRIGIGSGVRYKWTINNPGVEETMLFGTVSDDAIAFVTSNSERMRIVPGTGYVGIGTDTPASPLSIGTSVNNPVSANLLLSSQEPGAQLIMESTGKAADEKMWDFWVSHYDNAMHWRILNDANTEGKDYFKIKRTGMVIDEINLVGTGTTKVGIGTDNPQQTLDVEGNARINNKLYLGDSIINPTTPGGGGIYLAGVDPFIALEDTTAGADGKYWDFGLNLLNPNAFEFRTINDAGSAANTWMGVYRTGTAIDKIIFADGNIGINTDNPKGLLHVYTTGTYQQAMRLGEGDGYGESSALFTFDTTVGNGLLQIDTTKSGYGPGKMNINNYLGILNNDPQYALDVTGEANISTKIHTPELCLNGDCRANWPSGTGGNPFNQELNTTSNVQFASLNVTGDFNVDI